MPLTPEMIKLLREIGLEAAKASGEVFEEELHERIATARKEYVRDHTVTFHAKADVEPSGEPFIARDVSEGVQTQTVGGVFTSRWAQIGDRMYVEREYHDRLRMDFERKLEETTKERDDSQVRADSFFAAVERLRKELAHLSTQRAGLVKELEEKRAKSFERQEAHDYARKLEAQLVDRALDVADLKAANLDKAKDVAYLNSKLDGLTEAYRILSENYARLHREKRST